MDPVKGAAGLGAAALLVGGGYALKRGLDNWNPEISFLSDIESTEFQKSYTEGTLGEKYRKYLTNPNENEEWWKQKYEDVLKKVHDASGNPKPNESLSDEFKNGAVTKGFDKKDDKALNKVCDAAFKKQLSTDIKPSGTTKDKYRADIWKYCTIFEKELLTVKDSESDTYTANLGKTKEGVLAATKTTNNDLFWERKQKEFFYGGNNKNGTGEDAAGGKPFKQLHDQKSSKADVKGELKKVCETAYGATDNEAEVVKYCSLLDK
ncbi:hypothetical protein MHSWG343_05040 [Candidatus Mycoplasma haematohominis]|uniref:Uncharacterized protein n=1 Tax=Candidatus Mycoplasma haematohominis TaxID=1494318 RepID=A0A478FQV4_9MOLU|nr:hypothetical protein MHSWG343_05040 [Candidatus Mycoplasma haemohominis]